MPDPADATRTQLRNIEQATGLTVAQFATAVAEHGIEGHTRIIAFLKTTYGLTHGHANLVAFQVRELAAGGPTPADALLDAQYAAGKAHLRPIHDRLVAAARALGDVDVVVQKTGVSLRRARQLALIQAASSTRVALGLNLPPGMEAPRLVATPGQMCAYRVDVRSADEVDDEVRGWLAAAYDRAGQPGR